MMQKIEHFSLDLNKMQTEFELSGMLRGCLWGVNKRGWLKFVFTSAHSGAVVR